MRNIEIVYDKLFNRFPFIASSKEAEIIIVPSENDDMPSFSNVALIYLMKPSCQIQETFSDMKGNSVYVVYSNNLAVSSDIVTFLNRKGFYSSEEGALQVVSHISDILDIKEGSFLAEILTEIYDLIEGNISFEDYITYLLTKITNDEQLSRTLTQRYIDEFYVSFTARGFPGSNDNATNMETREFIGDRASWAPITKHFLARFNNEVTQNQMTHLHQDYASKEVQGPISYSMFMYKFIRTKSPITIGTHEDLLEAFIGTLYEISLREAGRGIHVNLELHKVFLNKLYDSFELTLKDKPIATIFSEMMVSLTKQSSDHDKGYIVKKMKNSIYIVLFRNGDHYVIEKHLMEKLNDPNRVEELLQLLRRKRNYSEVNKLREREAFFTEMVNGITNIVGEQLLCDLQNLKSLSVEQLNILKQVLPKDIPFACHLRNVDKNWSDTYWELEYNGRTLSTEDLPNPDLFETLVSMITQGNVEEQSSDTRIPILTEYTNGDFILQENVKYGIIPDASSWQVREYLANNSNARLFTIILGKEIDCSNTTTLEFHSPFQRFINQIPITSDKIEYVNNIRGILGFTSNEHLDLNNDMYSFLGIRVIVIFANRIFYSTLGNVDEHYLNTFQEHYTSKIVKREIAKLMKCPDTLSLDELVGRIGNDKEQEALVNLIYINLITKSEDCFQYGKEVNLICTLLTPEPPEERKVTETFRKSFFRTDKKSYSFKFNNIETSVSFKFKNYSWIRNVFEKEVYLHLLNVIGVHIVRDLLNRRFRNDPSYVKLAMLLKHKGIEMFTISTIELRNKKRLKLQLGKEFKIVIFDTIEEAYNKLSSNL